MVPVLSLIGERPALGRNVGVSELDSARLGSRAAGVAQNILGA